MADEAVMTMVRSKGVSGRKGVYGELVADLYNQLLTGGLKVGDKLPTEASLRETYGISVNSVRKGIEILVNDGFLSRRRGSGMYVERVPEKPVHAQKRDTIAIFYASEYYVYHPHFSEVRKSMEETILASGWKIKHLNKPVTRWESEYLADYTSLDESDESLQLLLNSPEIAGAVFSYSFNQALLKRLEANFPVVISGENADFPYVCFDYERALIDAIRLVIRKKSRKILIVGPSLDHMAGVFAKAKMLEDCDWPVEFIHRHVVGDARLFTQLTYDAYDVVQQILKEHGDVDGLVADSDFVAQGMLDAAALVNQQSGRTFHISAIVNECSRIHSFLDYEQVVIQGKLIGRKIVELLGWHIDSPETAPTRICVGHTIEQ